MSRTRCSAQRCCAASGARDLRDDALLLLHAVVARSSCDGAIQSRSAEGHALCGWRVYRQMPPRPSVAQSEMYVTVHLPGRHLRPEFGKDMLDEILVKLCRALSRRCLINCLAVPPRQRRKSRLGPPPRFPCHGRRAETGGKAARVGAGANTTAPRRTASTARTSTASTPSYAPGSVMGRVCQPGESRQELQRWLCIKLPKRQRSLGRMQRVGRRYELWTFLRQRAETPSPHTSYLDCVETKVFLGENRNKAHWFCSSLAAGNRFKVAPNSSDQDVASPYRPLAFCFS